MEVGNEIFKKNFIAGSFFADDSIISTRICNSYSGGGY